MNDTSDLAVMHPVGPVWIGPERLPCEPTASHPKCFHAPDRVELSENLELKLYPGAPNSPKQVLFTYFMPDTSTYYTCMCIHIYVYMCAWSLGDRPAAEKKVFYTATPRIMAYIGDPLMGDLANPNTPNRPQENPQCAL